MSRPVIPITYKTLWATGDVRLWADVVLLLKDSSGRFAQEEFRVDSAADVHKQTGLAIRSGILRFRIVGMDPDEYTVPCFFLGDPDTLPDPSQPATLPRNLLQPFALLDRLRFTAEKDPSLGNVYGELVVEKR
jgi:hypothetical protein